MSERYTSFTDRHVYIRHRPGAAPMDTHYIISAGQVFRDASPSLHVTVYGDRTEKSYRQIMFRGLSKSETYLIEDNDLFRIINNPNNAKRQETQLLPLRVIKTK